MIIHRLLPFLVGRLCERPSPYLRVNGVASTEPKKFGREQFKVRQVNGWKLAFNMIENWTPSISRSNGNQTLYYCPNPTNSAGGQSMTRKSSAAGGGGGLDDNDSCVRAAALVLMTIPPKRWPR